MNSKYTRKNLRKHRTKNPPVYFEGAFLLVLEIKTAVWLIYLYWSLFFFLNWNLYIFILLLLSASKKSISAVPRHPERNSEAKML